MVVENNYLTIATENRETQKRKPHIPRPLTTKQMNLLDKIYYIQKFMFNSRKIYDFLKQNYQNYNITSRQVGEWLKSQEVSQLHTRPKSKVHIRPSVATAPNQIYQMDLIDLATYKQKNFVFVMTMIDIFSKKAYAIPLKDKEAETVLKEFRKLLRKEKIKMRVLMSDNGKEFVNEDFEKFLKDQNIKHLTTRAHTPQQNGVVERFNGTLKGLIFKSFTVQNNYNWIDNLKKLVENYNNATSSSTGKTPNKLAVADQQEVSKVAEKKRVENVKKYSVISNKKFSIGDEVRIANIKGKLDKGYTQTFSKEIYEIEKVSKNKYGIFSYKLKGKTGSYDESKLLLVPDTTEFTTVQENSRAKTKTKRTRKRV